MVTGEARALGAEKWGAGALRVVVPEWDLYVAPVDRASRAELSGSPQPLE